MRAEDLVGLVACDLPRAAIPRRDEAFRVEHEDRVVRDVLDDHAKAFLALAQQLLVTPALGQVARDLRETDQLAVLVAKRGDDHVRPESRAVLLETPRLVLEAAVRGRPRELVLGPAALDGLPRIKSREVRADDLVGRIPGNRDGALVPAHDLAVRIEHEDRVIADGFDHEPRAHGLFAGGEAGSCGVLAHSRFGANARRSGGAHPGDRPMWRIGEMGAAARMFPGAAMPDRLGLRRVTVDSLSV